MAGILKAIGAATRAVDKHAGKGPKFPAGIALVQAGHCPLKLTHPAACTFCAYGHMTECHYPDTCSIAQCEHFKQQAAADADALSCPRCGTIPCSCEMF